MFSGWTGGFLQAVADGFGDAGGCGDRAEDDGAAGVVEGAEAVVETLGEDFGFVPGTAAEDVVSAGSVPFVGKHHSYGFAVGNLFVDRLDEL